MKLRRKRFSVAKVLLVIIVLAIGVSGGFYLLSINQNHKPDKRDSNDTSSSQKTSSGTASFIRPQKTDKELIIEAVKADLRAAKEPVEKYTVLEVDDILEDNARGHAGSEDGGGFAFYAHKEDGKWIVVARDQKIPGKAIGQKYNFPTDWYSTDY